MEELTNFANQLKHSELLTSDKLKELLRQFQQAGRAQGKKTAELTVEELCDFLVKQNAITNWQAEKLRAGKFRGFFLGKYKLLEILGAGGMSVVYLAENRVLDQKRAIKVLPKSRIENSSYLARFYKEARAAAALDHPNIVKTYDIDNQDDQHFMVMEFVEGEDLSQLVKREGGLPIFKAVEFTRQAALALAHAHENGLIHRDVKPSNFLVTPTGQIKLMDLGLAKTEDDTSSLTMMHNETLMGTADYLSPEQALNSHEVDHLTDIYSLGGTIYFMVAGHPPFPEGSIAQRLVKHQAIDPPDLTSIRKDCPAFLSELCQQMMKKKPAERIQTAKEVAHTLLTWQQGDQSKAFKENRDEASKLESQAGPSITAKSNAAVEVDAKSSTPVEKAKPELSAKPVVPSIDQKPISPAVNVSKAPNVVAAKVKANPGVANEPAEIAAMPVDAKSASKPAAPQKDKRKVPELNLGHELVNAASVHLELPEDAERKVVDRPTVVDLGTHKNVSPAAISIKTEENRKPHLAADGSAPIRRRTSKKDAIWILAALGILLLLSAVFMIWAFVFQGSTPPPVVK